MNLHAKMFAVPLALLLLSGCGGGRPDEYVPSHFSGSSRQTWVYASPDGRELPPYYEYDQLGGPVVLIAGWGYPAPNCWDGLDFTAATAVCDALWESGPGYDREVWRETALQDWEEAQAEGREFRPYRVSSETDLRYETDRVWQFTTQVTVSTPLQSLAVETVTNRFFDVSTGEELSLWDLFTVPEAEARARILDLFREEDRAVSPEDLERCFRPEYAGFERYVDPTFLEEELRLIISFPARTLDETSYFFTLQADGLTDILDLGDPISEE